MKSPRASPSVACASKSRKLLILKRSPSMQPSGRRSLGSTTERLLQPVVEQTAQQQQRVSFFQTRRNRLRHTVPSSQPDLPAFDSRTRISALLEGCDHTSVLWVVAHMVQFACGPSSYRRKRRVRDTLCTRSIWDWLAILIPLAGWLPRYKWQSRLWVRSTLSHPLLSSRMFDEAAFGEGGLESYAEEPLGSSGRNPEGGQQATYAMTKHCSLSGAAELLAHHRTLAKMQQQTAAACRSSCGEG